MAVDKELLDKLQEIADILSGKKKNINSGQNNSANVNTPKDVLSETAKKNAEDYIRQTKTLEEYTDEIKNNVFETETAYKRINKLNRELNDLHQKLANAGNNEVKRARVQYEIAQKINEIEREKAKIQVEGYTKLDEANAK